MKHIWKLPVGTPIIRYNEQLKQWQRFTTTVEVVYPEDEVDNIGDLDMWLKYGDPLSSLVKFLDPGECGVAKIPIPSTTYPLIMVSVGNARVLPDIDWDKVLHDFKDWIKDGKKIQWKFKNYDWNKRIPERNDIWEKPIFKKYPLEKLGEDYLYNDKISFTYSLIKEKNARFLSSITVA